MIWFKKNGNLVKSHHVGVVLSLIFCSLLVSFSSISNALAYNHESADLKPYNHWSVKYCNGCTVPNTRSSNYYGLKQPADMVDSSGNISSSNGARIGGDYVLGDFVVANTSNARQARYASIHLEFNLVTFALGQDFRPWTYRFSDFGVKSIDNATVLHSTVNYVFTPWSTTVQSGAAQLYYLSLGTMTFFVDAIIDTNSSYTYTPVWLGNSDGRYWLSTSDSSTQVGTYMEKYTGYIYWYDEGELDIAALQNVSNNVASGNQIIADDISKENSQDLEDRNNVQNISDDSATDGSNAQAQAENRSSSVLSAITNIYGMFNGPQETNCKIGPINLYGQMNLGELNFCTMGPIISSSNPMAVIILIGLVLLLSWSLIKTAIGLYHELFGGKG